MEVTAIGWALLILGPVLMLARPRGLYAITMFSLPFTATEVANVGSGLDASGVQISMFLGSLLLIRHGADRLWTMRLWLPNKGRAPIVWLGSFVAVTGISLAMPLWINGHVQVPSPYLGVRTSTPLFLHGGNFTGFLYMVYGFAFAYFVAETIQKAEMLGVTLKSFIAGSVFAAVWGMMEFACKISRVAYPGMIFNNGKGQSTLGYQVLFLTAGVPRISSVSVEASILAQTLLVALSLYLPFVFGKARLFGRKVDRLLFVLIFIALVLTFSSTAYLGLFILLLIVFALIGARRVLSPRVVASTLAGLGAAGLLYVSVPIVRTGLDASLFLKAESGSAIERLMTINNSYEMFLKYPVLGIGWGSITSHDLIVYILANGGLLALLTFTLAMYSTLRSLYGSIKSRMKPIKNGTIVQMDFALFIALGVTLATCILSGFLNVFSFFWFTVGFAIAGSRAAEFDTDNLQERPSCEPKCEAGARNPAIRPRPC